MARRQVLETYRKLLLVGFLTFMNPGSMMQLIAALVVSLIYFALQMQARPFRDSINDTLAGGLLLATVSVFICCVLLKVRRRERARSALAGALAAGTFATCGV